MSGCTIETVPSRARRSPHDSSGWLAASLQVAGAHRLVVPEREDDRVLRLPERRAQLEVGGRGVERVPGGHDERVDLARPRAPPRARASAPPRPAGRAAPARGSATVVPALPSAVVHRAPRARGRRAAGAAPATTSDLAARAGEVLRDRRGRPSPARPRRARRAAPSSASPCARGELRRDRARERERPRAPRMRNRWSAMPPVTENRGSAT